MGGSGALEPGQVARGERFAFDICCFLAELLRQLPDLRVVIGCISECGRSVAEAPVIAPAARRGPREPCCRYVGAAGVWDLVVHLRRIVLRACDRHDGCGGAICVPDTDARFRGAAVLWSLARSLAHARPLAAARPIPDTSQLFSPAPAAHQSAHLRSTTSSCTLRLAGV